MVGIINVVLAFISFSYFLLRLHRSYPDANQILVLTILVWGINMAFSVLASPIALRFQLFPIIIEFIITLVLVDYVAKAAFSEETRILPTKEFAEASDSKLM
jgi:hypothetical protein